MGDFERTFGAGVDAVSIIDGFSRTNHDPHTPTANCVYLSSFKDAISYAKEFPGNTLRRARDGKRFILEFDDQNFAFDFSQLQEDLKKNAWDYPSMFITAVKEKYDLINFSTSPRLLAERCTKRPVKTPPVQLSQSIEKLKQIQYVFYPVCKEVCLILTEDSESRLEAVIITENGASTIVCSNWQKIIYDALMGVNGRGEQIR